MDSTRDVEAAGATDTTPVVSTVWNPEDTRVAAIVYASLVATFTLVTRIITYRSWGVEDRGSVGVRRRA
jgi:hypothetical protein